jgi:predicted transcriptional regulator
MDGNVKQLSDNMSVADRLRTAMWDAGLGVGELAKRTGISPRLIAKYRKGPTEPRDYFGRPTHNAVLMAEVLGVHVDTLVPPDVQHSPEAAA